VKGLRHPLKRRIMFRKLEKNLMPDPIEQNINGRMRATFFDEE
jgi:hypothetical protein